MVEQPANNQPKFQDLDPQLLHGLVSAATFLIVIEAPDISDQPGNGSGLGLAVGDRRFVITAAHCVAERRRGGISNLNITVLHSGSHLPLIPSSIHSTTSLKNDPLDIGIIELVAETVPREIHFPRIFDFAPHYDIGQTGVMMMAGFPGEKFSVRGRMVSAGPNVFGLQPIPYEELSGKLKRKSDKNAHVHLRYLRNKLELVNDDMYSGRLEPYGISGGAIWSARHIEVERVVRFKPVAIAHEWLKSEACVRGTRVNYAISLMIHAFPELRSELAKEMESVGQSLIVGEVPR